MKLMPVEEAFAKVTGDARPLERIERIGLSEAAGRVLARPLPALRTQPPFDASAMDGYALRAADVASGGATLRVVGESAAGRGFGGALGPGQAVRIFTGAPVPAGADAVVIQEDTERLEGAVRIDRTVPPGANIRKAGSDFLEGNPGLSAGRVLDPAAVMLAAAMNHPELDVVARPRVAILATGDELCLPGSAPGPDQIIASNTFGIAGLARQAGAEVIDLGIAPDRMDALDAAVEAAFAAEADILVTIGGASVGDHDLVHKALTARGMALDFWKIAMRPGKPLMSGRIRAMRVLGLPGNPASSLVCSYLFLEPLVRILAGLPPAARLRPVILGNDLRENDLRQDYLRARLETDSAGRPVAYTAASQDSSLMRIFAESDCLVIRPPFAPAAIAGDTATALLLHA